MSYRALYKRSIHERDAYWARTGLPHPLAPPVRHRLRCQPPAVCEMVRRRTDQSVPQRSRPPRARPGRPGRPGLRVHRNQHRRGSISYGQLLVEVERMAAILQSLGVGKGDRVLIYMPMIPQAVIAMLATVRLGAIHSWCSAALPATRWPAASTMPPLRSSSPPMRAHAAARSSPTSPCWTKPCAKLHAHRAPCAAGQPQAGPPPRWTPPVTWTTGTPAAA
jgi:hypothetical protein